MTITKYDNEPGGSLGCDSPDTKEYYETDEKLIEAISLLLTDKRNEK